jgi:tetratricopeptide (TPR) repeat protein
MRRLARIVLVLTLLVLAVSPVRAQEASGWIGQRVLTMAGTLLRADPPNDGASKAKAEDRPQSQDGRHPASIFAIYRVEQARGAWLRLVAEKEDARGWVPVAQVVPYDRAIEHVTAAIQSGSAGSWEYLTRGLLWTERRAFDKAIADFNEAIARDLLSATAYDYRGLAWYGKRDYDKAITDFNDAIRLSPRFARAHVDRGNAWRAKGAGERAIADYNEAIAVDPKNVRAYVERGTAWRIQGNSEKAINDFGEALRLDPSYAPAHNARGLAWDEQGDTDRAIADYTEAIRLDPRLAEAYLNRGNAWQAKREPDKVIADFTEATRADPGSALAFIVRGNYWHTRGKYDKALADFNDAVRADPEESGGHVCRAWLLATCPVALYRDGPGAVASATRACELTGWKGAYEVSTLAAACAEAGDFDAAVKWQEKAVALYDDAILKENARARLALYRAREPYRVKPGD